MKEITEPEYSMQTYDESILEEYADKYNLMFLKLLILTVLELYEYCFCMHLPEGV